MAENPRCPECGTELGSNRQDDLCPRCLLNLALDFDDPGQALDQAAEIPESVGGYRILKILGEGGMGIVYLARDTSLRRHVALKFLSSAIDSDPNAQRRFLREARTAAALDHPYICHIHEVSESDERAFIAMEYIRGQTLKERLAEGPLAPKEAVRLAAEVAEALERAHDEGIVHRDLKPGNIMLTSEGHVKVMDFGLAKRVPVAPDLRPADAQTTLTETGTVIGTVAYMSPEQVRGGQVDGRTDIFSFGIILYQMLCGHHPFKRDSAMEIASTILRDDPPPLSGGRDDLPAELVGVVNRMLEKDPARRFQSVGEVGALLREMLGESSDELVAVAGPGAHSWGRWLGWAAAGVLSVLLVLALVRPNWVPLPVLAPDQLIESVAVLPFENLTGDPELAFLSDGMTETLIRNLGGLGGLGRVAPLDSVLNRDGALSEIASQLDVDAVVDGSIASSESGFMIRVYVIDADTESSLFDQSYPGRLADLPAVQAEATRAIAAALKIPLAAHEERSLRASAEVDSDAYALYLRGRQQLLQREAAALERAIRYFHQAIALDTQYATAFEGLADAYLLLSSTGYSDRPPSDVLPLATQFAQRALQLDDRLAGAHTILAEALLTKADWAAAEDHYQRARRLAPSSAQVHQRYSLFLAARGELDRAETEIRRAMRLAPVSASVNATLARILYYRRDKAAATRQYLRTLEMEPRYVPAHLGLGLIDLSEQRFPDAMARFRESAVPESVINLLGNVLAGRVLLDGKAAARLQTSGGYVSPFYLGVVFSLLDDAESALVWLEKARDDRSDYVVFAAVDPIFDPIRDDPRFGEFVASLGLAPK